MKSLRLHFTALALLVAFAFGPPGATPARAQQLIACINATSTPCVSSHQVGNGFQGDDGWLFSGKVNENFLALPSELFSTHILTVPHGGTGVATITGLIKGNGTSAFSVAAATDVIPLWSGTCSASTFLRGDGSCQTPVVPISTGVSGLGVGVAAFLAVPSSANLAAAVTGETGTAGGLVFSNNPVLTLPAIAGSSTGATTIASANASASNFTVTLPAATDTVTLNAATQTLTNKSIAGSEINSGTIPAAQLPVATTGAFGAVKPDGTTITVSAGVITASGGSATTITPGTTTISGATAPCLIDNSTGTTMGCAPLAQTLALNSGTLGTVAPSRTVTSSPTVASTDMGGVIYSNVTGGGTVTIPAISSAVFAAHMTLTVVNYSASTAAVSATPTVNAGGGCVSGTGIPAGAAWEIVSNGTTLDCNQTVSSSSGGSTNATTINSAAVPASAGMIETNGSSQIVAQTVQTSTLSSGATNDFAVGTGVGVLFATPASGGSTLNGITAGIALQNLYIVNAEAAGGADLINLANQSASDTTAANRFLTSATGSLAIPAGGRVLCIYLAGSINRWECQ
jgi:hypothetical protein